MNVINNDFEPDLLEAINARVEGMRKWRSVIEATLRRVNSLTVFNDYLLDVMAGRVYLFLNAGAFALVKPDQRSQGLMLHIDMSGGNYIAMMELEKDIYQFAKHVDAKRITTLGRAGFSRRKRPDGWLNTNQIWFSKEVM